MLSTVFNTEVQSHGVGSPTGIGAGNRLLTSMGTPLSNDDEKRLSLVGLIVRINDKVQRLLNLIVKNNREAQNEPAIDAFKDLSVYGIIAQIVQNGKWGK